MKPSTWVQTRRLFVRHLPIAAIAVGGLQISCGSKEDEEEVSTNEDLMREHGVLKRVLLTYQEIARRIRANQDFSPQAVTDGADIVRKFIEDSSMCSMRSTRLDVA